MTIDPTLTKLLIGLILFIVLCLFVYKDKIAKVKPSYIALTIISFLLLVLLILGYTAGFVSYLPNLLLMIFILWGIIFALSIDRKYLYGSALTFLILCPIFILFKMDNVAEYSAVLAYLMLCAGVAKDLLYDHIYEN